MKDDFLLELHRLNLRGVSDLKACLEYCEHPARSCEHLNFCFPAQTEPF